MKERITCMAELTKWIDVKHYRNHFSLVNKAVEDINIAIKNLLTKSQDSGILCVGANVFVKKDFTDGEKNLRFYVTICGRHQGKYEASS